MEVKSLVSLALLATCFALCSSQETPICPAGYIHNGGNCFKVFDKVNELSWLEALKECKKENGTLAEPVNKSVTEFLRELAHIYHNMVGLNQWFIGLTDMLVDNQWSFPSSCGQANYALWRNETPNEDVMASTDCAVMVWEDDEISWQDVSCTDHKGSSSDPIVPICQVRIAGGIGETPGPEEEREIRCPPGFRKFQNHCYYLSDSDEDKTYNDAQESCRSVEAHLASVHSEEENQFIGMLARGRGYVWLGGSDTGSRSFRWLDGSPMDYKNFKTSEPDYGSDQAIQMNVANYKWIDYRKGDTVDFVCKI